MCRRAILRTRQNDDTNDLGQPADVPAGTVVFVDLLPNPEGTFTARTDFFATDETFILTHLQPGVDFCIVDALPSSNEDHLIDEGYRKQAARIWETVVVVPDADVPGRWSVVELADDGLAGGSTDQLTFVGAMNLVDEWQANRPLVEEYHPLSGRLLSDRNDVPVAITLCTEDDTVALWVGDSEQQVQNDIEGFADGGPGMGALEVRWTTVRQIHEWLRDQAEAEDRDFAQLAIAAAA